MCHLVPTFENQILSKLKVLAANPVMPNQMIMIISIIALETPLKMRETITSGGGSWILSGFSLNWVIEGQNKESKSREVCPGP